MIKRIQYWVALALLMALSAFTTGCALVENNRDFLQRYEAQYKTQHPYVVHNVLREGHTIHVREFGQQHQGAPLILMHGFPDSLHLYDRVIPLLAKQRRVIAFDFIGWGESSKPTTHVYNAESLRKDLDAVIAHLNLDQVILVAHDISGFPAIDWALEQPNKIENLVLLNSIYNPMDAVILPEAIATFSAQSTVRDIRRWAASRSDGLWQRGVRKQLNRFFSDHAISEPYLKIFTQQALTIRPAFFGLNAVLDAEVESRAQAVANMHAFTKPVTIIFGGDDPYLNTDVAKAFDAAFPNSRLHIVQGAGHYVQLDNPVEVARLMLKAVEN